MVANLNGKIYKYALSVNTAMAINTLCLPDHVKTEPGNIKNNLSELETLVPQKNSELVVPKTISIKTLSDYDKSKIFDNSVFYKYKPGLFF